MSLFIVFGKFPTGEIVMAPEAQSKVPSQIALIGLLRHITGDWGELEEDDWKLNDEALECGARLQSRYSTPDGKRFWIVTEHNRLITTIYLPLEH